jgi:hypothetical protein
MRDLKIGNVEFDEIFAAKICSSVNLEFALACSGHIEISGRSFGCSRSARFLFDGCTLDLEFQQCFFSVRS